MRSTTRLAVLIFLIGGLVGLAIYDTHEEWFGVVIAVPLVAAFVCGLLTRNGLVIFLPIVALPLIGLPFGFPDTTAREPSPGVFVGVGLALPSTIAILVGNSARRFVA